METRTLGSLWPVSCLTIGGGGIGQVWGATSREEAVATVRSAVDGGITFIDVAPSYGDGEAELVVGEAFDGSLPDGVRISTKHHVAQIEPAEVEPVLRRGLEESLERMRLDRVDLYFLHSQIVPEPDPDRPTWTTPRSLYEEAVVSVFETMVDQGRIGAWGITAVQFPGVVQSLFAGSSPPQAAQMIANLLDAPGDMAWTEEPIDYRDLIRQAKENGVGVMGIRAVQAGALTDGLDRSLDPGHPAAVDFDRAAPFRDLGSELGESPATLAHRYALTIDGVDTVVLGVKDRAELADCLRAAELGPLPDDEKARIDEVAARIRRGAESG